MINQADRVAECGGLLINGTPLAQARPDLLLPSDYQLSLPLPEFDNVTGTVATSPMRRDLLFQAGAAAFAGLVLPRMVKAEAAPNEPVVASIAAKAGPRDLQDSTQIDGDSVFTRKVLD